MTGTLDLSQVADALDRAVTLESLWKVVVDFFRSAAFGGISYVVFESGRRGEVSLLLRDGVPDHVHQGFIDLGLGRHDVNFRHALTTGRPSLRSQTVRNIALSPKELEHHQGREALNYGDSLTLPLYGPNNHVAVISLGLPSAPSDFDEHRWTTLHMAAQGAHLRCLQLYKELGAQPHSLSVREVEVLDWVARGKSNAVIADILGIASTTVDTYLRRIFDKLDVADRTSAAVKAATLGLIRL